MARTKKPDQPETTSQRLRSVVKSCRDIMRKDRGVNSDIDRLPQLTWMMFLKFLDDLERIEEQRAELAGKRHQALIEKPYRWRDWAAQADGITGDELLAFLNQDEVKGPNGKPMKGLFAYLRGLQSGDRRDRRAVVGEVFRGIYNRMVSGFLIRDMVNKLNALHFTSSEELYVLSGMYESMLREMRDAAGDSGEFYTPRAVVKAIVQVMDPRLGEVVEDPACGTGGFLVESFDYLRQQADTVAKRRTLQENSIRGGEAKPLPYLLCQMNLLLHGMEIPDIDHGNSLRRALNDIGDSDRADIILTNPPFGGEEERSIQNNFPDDRRTAETALLFLQLIMRKLRRQVGGKKGGRAAVIVPNGVLFADGAAARIKEDLIRDFNLHTVVRLPDGVFAPYTSIKTNILFFERGGPTQDIWYYEHPLPEGKKNYTKTNPILFEEFTPFTAWWKKRELGPQAWKVAAADVMKNEFNLDIINPNATEELDHRSPDELVENILAKEARITELMLEVKAMLRGIM
jgi:type I restriction enzyme M protein